MTSANFRLAALAPMPAEAQLTIVTLSRHSSRGRGCLAGLQHTSWCFDNIQPDEHESAAIVDSVEETISHDACNAQAPQLLLPVRCPLCPADQIRLEHLAG